MKKTYQIVVECADPSKVTDFTEKHFSIKKEDIPEGLHLEVYELDQKIRYTLEDSDTFGIVVHVRIPKASSPEYIAGFSAMFAYWNKLKDEGDYLSFSPSGTLVSVAESHLQSLSAFVWRMEGLGYRGSIEVKIEPYPLSFTAKGKSTTKEEVLSRLLDKHVKLLDWTEIQKYTAV